MTAGQLRDAITLSDEKDDGTLVTFLPNIVPAAIVEGPPGSFDEFKNAITVWIRFHPQVTTNTTVRWRDYRRSANRSATVRGFRDVHEHGVVWLEMLCEEVRTP